MASLKVTRGITIDKREKTVTIREYSNFSTANNPILYKGTLIHASTRAIVLKISANTYEVWEAWAETRKYTENIIEIDGRHFVSFILPPEVPNDAAK